jgi:hypothetical protein
MTEFNRQAEAVAAKIAPALAAVGFDRSTRYSIKGRGPFRVHFWGQDRLGFGPETREGIDLFVTDAYPDHRDEAFVFTWTGIGSSSKQIARAVADALNEAGIAARVTTRKGDYGVAFKAEFAS